jgi:hypothetical protein
MQFPSLVLALALCSLSTAAPLAFDPGSALQGASSIEGRQDRGDVLVDLGLPLVSDVDVGVLDPRQDLGGLFGEVVSGLPVSDPEVEPMITVIDDIGVDVDADLDLFKTRSIEGRQIVRGAMDLIDSVAASIGGYMGGSGLFADAHATVTPPGPSPTPIVANFDVNAGLPIDIF